MEIAELQPYAPQIALFLLTVASVGGLLYASFLPAGDRKARKDSRIARVGSVARHSDRQGANSAENRRRRVVEDTIKELEAKQKAKMTKGGKPTLISRMRQAGLAWTKSTYFMVCLTVGLVSYLIALIALKVGVIPALGFGAAAGMLLPHMYVSRKRNARFKKFSSEFPNALDVIVRGVKSGMPLVDTLKSIAADAQEPVKGEFEELIADQTLGVPIDEALQRMAVRMPISEANFFAIVIAIQARTGGNLSEALGNLSKVLRDRKNLRGKIRAMSAEAKASAGIIGSMPIVVALLLYFVSPDYISSSRSGAPPTSRAQRGPPRPRSPWR